MKRDVSYATGELAAAVGGRLVGPDALRIEGIDALHCAGPEQITFIADAAHARKWGESKAGAALISEGLHAAGHEPKERALIYVTDAELALIEVLRRFEPLAHYPEPGVHRTAWVHESVGLGQGIRIGPHVSIESGAVIGNDVVLHAGCRIDADVVIGDGSILHSGCVIRTHCRIGRGVILHAGVVIGSDGFGYRPAPDGSGLLKMPHIGSVIIEDAVEIGANSCVDRGKFSETIIGAGTKIDNLVQIAHNCVVGRSCVIAGLAGLAGSVTIGDGVQIGAQAGVVEGRTIGDGARIGAQAGVMRDVPPGMTVLGAPAEEASVALRQAAAVRKLGKKG